VFQVKTVIKGSGLSRQAECRPDDILNGCLDLQPIELAAGIELEAFTAGLERVSDNYSMACPKTVMTRPTQPKTVNNADLPLLPA